jgi:hypothetical protein
VGSPSIEGDSPRPTPQSRLGGRVWDLGSHLTGNARAVNRLDEDGVQPPADAPLGHCRFRRVLHWLCPPSPSPVHPIFNARFPCAVGPHPRPLSRGPGGRGENSFEGFGSRDPGPPLRFDPGFNVSARWASGRQGPGFGVRGPGSGVRGRESGIRSQRAGQGRRKKAACAAMSRARCSGPSLCSDPATRQTSSAIGWPKGRIGSGRPLASGNEMLGSMPRW